MTTGCGFFRASDVFPRRGVRSRYAGRGGTNVAGLEAFHWLAGREWTVWEILIGSQGWDRSFAGFDWLFVSVTICLGVEDKLVYQYPRERR